MSLMSILCIKVIIIRINRKKQRLFNGFYFLLYILILSMVSVVFFFQTVVNGIKNGIDNVNKIIGTCNIL